MLNIHLLFATFYLSKLAKLLFELQVGYFGERRQTVPLPLHVLLIESLHCFRLSLHQTDSLVKLGHSAIVRNS